MVSLTVAYVLLACGGPVGLHLVYVGRERQAWACAVTGGLAGLAVVRDAICLPRYVREANGEAQELAKVSREAATHPEHPRISWQKAVAMLVLAMLVGTTLARCFADDLASRLGFPGGELYRELFVAVSHVLGTSFGAWVVGGISWDFVRLGYVLTGATFGALLAQGVVKTHLLPAAVEDNQEGIAHFHMPEQASALLPALCAVLAAHMNGARKWKPDLLAEAHNEEEAARAEALAMEAASKVAKITTSAAEARTVVRRNRVDREKKRRLRMSGGRCGFCFGLLRVYLGVVAFLCLVLVSMYESASFTWKDADTSQGMLLPSRTIRVKTFVNNWVASHQNELNLASETAGLVFESVVTRGLRETVSDLQTEIPLYAKKDALKTLGLPETASLRQVRTRFREISFGKGSGRFEHVGVNGDSRVEKSIENYDQIIAAYEILKRLLQP
ncbi:DnaJ-like subfamily C member 22 [Hondaea fermentalgiana]|uniref:DnaJ-like subfamily C member 22 n=1 Tax=Hondaea fermentalgiana TaxID=2315210 RepID=A0A2R5G8I2_9STRA|nr:DnaJ-like subfamily C member 22 [Hondaea fermentalgiana]|eukprot:GBG26088.1 DnaJ-like subfamily C member 22 [Hondaea fermentalgiana]